jgi:hypothetical protein
MTNYNTQSLEEAYEVFGSNLKAVKDVIDANFELFVNLWEASATQHEWFVLADKIHREAFGQELDKRVFDKGWQYRTVNHPDIEQAKTELLGLICGWW